MTRPRSQEDTRSAGTGGTGKKEMTVLREGLEKRLFAYALAAGAGITAAAPAAAHIVFTPAYVTVTITGGGCGVNTLPIDLNHDGINDFQVQVSIYGQCIIGVSFLTYGTNWLLISPAQPGNKVIVGTPCSKSNFGAPPGAAALKPGDLIAKTDNFSSNARCMAVYALRPLTYPVSEGPWLGVVSGRYLGLEFEINGRQHFGWARFNVSGFTATLTGYAYETVPGKAIRAGETGPVVGDALPELRNAPPTSASLQPATLGLLALGSSGLDVWRREEAV